MYTFRTSEKKVPRTIGVINRSVSSRQTVPDTLLNLVFWLLIAIPIESYAADTWPLFRGDPASQGVSNEKLPVNLVQLWEFAVPKGAFESTPIIAEDRVFIGDMDGEIYALDLKTGKRIWKVETDGGFPAAGAYQNGIVVFGDYDGNVRALRSSNGQGVWEFKANGQIHAGINFYGDSVLLTSEGGSLYSLKLATGDVNWHYEIKDQLQGMATVIGNRTFLGGCDSHLHVVDLDTGKSGGEGLNLGGPSGSTAAAIGDIAIVPTQPGAVFGFNWKSNKQIWMFSDPELSSEIRSSPAIKNGLAIVTTRSRRLLALDIKTGEIRWKTTLQKRSDSSPVICDGRVWVGASDGRIAAFDLENGKETWMTEVPGAFLGSPAIAQQRLVIASDRGSVFCFGPAPL